MGQPGSTQRHGEVPRIHVGHPAFVGTSEGWRHDVGPYRGEREERKQQQECVHQRPAGGVLHLLQTFFFPTKNAHFLRGTEVDILLWVALVRGGGPPRQPARRISLSRRALTNHSCISVHTREGRSPSQPPKVYLHTSEEPFLLSFFFVFLEASCTCTCNIIDINIMRWS